MMYKFLCFLSPPPLVDRNTNLVPSGLLDGKAYAVETAIGEARHPLGGVPLGHMGDGIDLQGLGGTEGWPYADVEGVLVWVLVPHYREDTVRASSLHK